MKAKRLLIDIETSPLVAQSWGPMWETNLIKVLVQSQVISFSAKWVGGKHITKALCDYKGYKKGELNDKRLIQEIWGLLNEADVVIAQNGKDFDIKHLNTRFLFHGMPPPSPYRVVDTKVEAKKYLRLPSNKLDDIGTYYSVGNKLEHEGFALWEKCMAGDRAAWGRMKRYNAQDVVLLEKIYMILLPFIKHPNLGMYTDKLVCPKCGSGKLQSRGYQITMTAKYKRVHCQDCGGWARTVNSEPREDKPYTNA